MSLSRSTLFLFNDWDEKPIPMYIGKSHLWCKSEVHFIESLFPILFIVPIFIK